MENKFLDNVLEQLIDDAATIYLENQKYEEINEEEINFSDTHNAKMKKLFKEVKASDNRKKILNISKKVAVILVWAIIIMGGLIGTVKAWREQAIKFIMKNNQDNYMNISFGEKLDDLESGDYIKSGEESVIYEVDGIKFLYVPENFEYRYDKINDKFKYFSFENKEKNKFIMLKKENIEDIDKAVDIEKVCSEKLIFEDKEVFKVNKEDKRTFYIWYDENNSYSIGSNLEDEEEILKFIDNIKILKNF